MNNSPIEDIIIENRSSEKSKKGRGILVILVFLIILLIGLSAFYLYLKNNQKQPVKQLFFTSISNADFEFYTNNKLYTEILNKYLKNNSKTEANLTFSTTMEQPEEFENIDISKFTLDFNAINNINSSEAYAELGVSYSGNELLKLKAINNENQFAWFSEEIVDKYVGINKSNSERVLNQGNLNIENTENEKSFSNLTNQFKYISNEEIELDKNTKIQEYLDYISNYLPEEKFSSQSNFVLEREGLENVNVTAYSLKLTNQEYNELIKNLFSKIRNDETTISQMVTGNEIQKETTNFTIKATTNLEPVGTENDGNIQNENVTINQENSINQDEQNADVQESNTNQIIDDTNNNQENNENRTEDNVNTQENNTNQTEDNTISQENNTINQNETLNQVNNNEATDVVIPETNEEERLDFNQILIALFTNRKIDCSVSDFQEAIDKFIEEGINGENDFELTVYVSENLTEKIHISLPNISTIDIDFITKSNSEKNIIITYLIEENGLVYGEDNAVIYSAADNTITEEVPVVTEKQTNGFKLDFYKLQSEASTKIKTTYNIIENEEINKKITINLITDGTVNSKNFENEINIIYSTNDGDFKINIENEIQFGVSAEIEPLTEENSLFLDTLSDEELVLTIDTIKEKVKTVYESKKENLSFIDTNTQTSLIKPNIVTKDEARDILINTIVLQMTEAQEKGEEYTIQNLANLEIDGHEVSVSIENDIATVSVDGHNFAIDSEFGLMDI